MIDAKITLELLQNGIQKFIFAKTSEQQARRILCTLTENGKVFNVSGYSFKVYHKEGDTVYYYDDPEQVYQIPGTSTIAFILPANQTGEKVYELCITQNNTIIYAPQFKVYYEGTIGPGVTPDPGTVTAYEPKITLSEIETTYDEDDYFVLSAEESPNDTYRLSVKDFVESLDGDDIAYDSSNSISDKIDDIDDVLDTKVDKVDGKGLSTNDYTDAEKTKLSGIESGAQVNTITSVNTKTGAVVLDGDDIAYDNSNSVNDKIDALEDTFDSYTPTASLAAVALSNDYDDLDNKYTLPTASASTLGGVKVDGTSITIADGVISSTATGKATEIEDANNPGYAVDTPRNIYDRIMGGEVFVHSGSPLSFNWYNTAQFNAISFIYTYPTTAGIQTEYRLLEISSTKAITVSAYGDTLSPAQRSKLNGIEAGAEVNVQSDWNQTDDSADDYIKNKPTIPSPYSLPAATTSALGGVKIDDETIKIDANGVITAEAESSVLTLTITSGVSNYTKSELTAAVTAGKVIKYDGRVLQFSGESTYTISFYDFKASEKGIGTVTVGTQESETAASRQPITNGTLATNNQTVDGTTDTIANHLTSLSSQIANLNSDINGVETLIGSGVISDGN